MTDDLPPGVRFNADGRVATVVFEGAGPNPAMVAPLEARLSRTGLLITTTQDPMAGLSLVDSSA